MKISHTLKIAVAVSAILGLQSVWLWIVLTWVRRNNFWVVSWCLICELITIIFLGVQVRRSRK